MAKKSRFEKEPEPKPDLTPMIDIVFNLIIFFMIVSELSNLDVEQIELPFADNAEDPKLVISQDGDTDKVLQVNVMPEGLIKVSGRAYTMEPQLKDQYPNFSDDFLKIEVAGYPTEPNDANPGGEPLSKLRLNIRADKEVPFKFVQFVFDACMTHKVYKTSIAATEDEPK